MKRKKISIILFILLILSLTIPFVNGINFYNSNKTINGVIDQYQEHSDGWDDINDNAWQEFIPIGDNLLSVQVKIRKSFIWPPNLNLSIEKPLGNVLTNTSLPSQSIPWETCDWVIFNFPDIPLEKEQTYYIVLSYKGNQEGNYDWSGAWGNLYPQGESSKDPQWDWCFRTIVDKNYKTTSLSFNSKNERTDLYLVNYSNNFLLNNNPPNPPIITGSISGKVRVSYIYYITVSDPDENDGLWELEVDFGDEIIVEKCDSGACTPWKNGETIEIKYMWKKAGNYNVTARVMDVYGEWSEWSDPLIVSMLKNKRENLHRGYFQAELGLHNEKVNNLTFDGNFIDFKRGHLLFGTVSIFNTNKSAFFQGLIIRNLFILQSTIRNNIINIVGKFNSYNELENLYSGIWKGFAYGFGRTRGWITARII